MKFLVEKSAKIGKFWYKILDFRVKKVVLDVCYDPNFAVFG